MKIDAVICTFNSINTIKECINSISLYLQPEHIIVVDGGSTDGTLDYLSSHDLVEVHLKPELSLSESRQYSFSKVTSEWFLQIDSDVILKEPVMPFLEKYKDHTDVIEFGVNNHSISALPEDPHSSSYHRRAFFFANLIKKKCLPDIDINVRHMEEELMRRYVLDQGGSWLKTGILIGDHYTEPMRYEGRRNTEIIRNKPLPNWVYEDMGKIDKNTSQSFKKVIFSLAVVSSNAINRNAFIEWYKSFKFPFMPIFSYFKGYFKTKKSSKYFTNKNL
jgi:glycosyltransferase involved in cell wall biosynthesis